jgi:flagella basal body P-ring formation protein FlgA
VIVMLQAIALAVALTGPVPAAIERAVQERMGDVRVEVVEMTGPRLSNPESRIPNPGLVAIPEPGSRLGRVVRFILVAGQTRLGSVVATLHVTGSAVRSSRAIARGEELEADTLEVMDVELKDILLGRLPTMADVVGTQARRDIRKGEVLTGAVVIVPPLVKSGDEVRVSVSTGVIEVTGVGRASGSGHVGDLIRVLMPSSRRGLNARITGPGAVEIVR